MKTAVHITVDTESSMGGAWQHRDRRPLPASRHVFCQNEQGAFGLPLIVEELGRYGFRATFFCEMLATHVLGEADTRSVTDALMAARQDVQLHVHPTYWHYARARQAESGGSPRSPRMPGKGSDVLAAHSAEEQLNLLGEAVDIFRACTGRVPDAFRAGNFAANRATLRALTKLGVVVDSSLNPVYRSQGSFEAEALAVNLVQRIEGVWEFPVTVARTRLPEGGGLKPFDPCALSVVEMERILDAAHAAAMRHVTLVFHCFSFVKPRDIFYSAFRPDRIVIGRLRRLLRFLGRNAARFEVRTLGETATDLAALDGEQHAVVPELGFWRPAVRKTVQAVNRLYWV